MCKCIQILSAGFDHFMNPVDLWSRAWMTCGHLFSATSTASTLATYHLSSHTAATQSWNTGTTSASSGHSLRRCWFHNHGHFGLNLALVKHCWQWHDLSVVMTFPGAMAVTAWIDIVPGTGFSSPNFLISDWAALQVSLETKEKATELKDWSCCIQAKKSEASWMVTFCWRIASSVIRWTQPPTP